MFLQKKINPQNSSKIMKTQSEIYIERLEQLMKLIVENYKMNLEKEAKFNNHLSFH